MSLLVAAFSSDQDVSIVNSATVPSGMAWRWWSAAILSHGGFSRYVATFPDPTPSSIARALELLSEDPTWELIPAQDALRRIQQLYAESNIRFATLVQDAAMLTAPDLCPLSNLAMSRANTELLEGTLFPEGAFPPTIRITSLIAVASQLGFLPTTLNELRGVALQRIAIRAQPLLEAPEFSLLVRHVPWRSLRRFIQSDTWPTAQDILSNLRGIDRNGAALVPRYLRRRRVQSRREQPLAAIASFKGDITGGAEVSLRNFWRYARRLDKILVVPWPGTLCEACPGRYLVHPVQVNPFSMGRIFAHAQSLKRLLRKEAVDIVYTNNAHAAQVPVASAILLGIPSVTRLIGVTVRRNLDVSFLRWTDKVIVPSAHLKYHAVKCGVDEGRIAMVHEAVDDRFLRDIPLASETRRTEKTIGVFARLTPEKRIEECIRTLALLRASDPDYRMSIFGWSGTDGSSAIEKLRALARGLGVESALQFRGFAHDVLKAYSTVGLVLHLAEEEGWGMVVTEAMALGLPVVANASGGIPEQIVDGETGLLCHTGHAEEAARLVDRIQRDSSLKNRLVWGGVDHVRRHFSARVIAPQIEDILLQVLNESPKRADTEFETKFRVLPEVRWKNPLTRNKEQSAVSFDAKSP